MPIQKLFTTQIYFADLGPGTGSLNRQLRIEIDDVEALDKAGAAWSKANYKNGFTSYASANEMHRNSPTFAELEKKIDRHVAQFAAALDMDLGRKKLRMNTCWINVMRNGARHGMHIHPLSVISGTYYVQVPPGASSIKFEDPRLPMFMAAPPKKLACRPVNRIFSELQPRAGRLVLFESWLRHEVPPLESKKPRISVSFNYSLD